MKKAIIEIQFHWIFVLVAGAIILLFFGSIILKQKSISEQHLSVGILNNLDGIITGSIVSPRTLSSIDYPEIEINFQCDSFSVGRTSKSTGKHVIFAPNLLRGRALKPWALPWEVPYRVTNFLYLTTDNFKYILIKNDAFDFDERVNEELLVTKQFIDRGQISSLQNTNNYKIKFIFFNEGSIPSIDPDLGIPDKDVTAINIIPLTDASGKLNWDIGEIEFYKLNSATNKFDWAKSTEAESTKPYLKEASLYGAIFSEDPDSYECAMKKAFRRLNLVNEIYITRTGSLKNYFETYYPMSPEKCNLFYYHENLNSIQTISNELSSSVSSTDMPEIEGLYKSSNELTDQNIAAELRSCPLLY